MECFAGADLSPAHCGLVILSENGAVEDHLYIDFEGRNVNTDFRLRVEMAEKAHQYLCRYVPKMVCLEDYALGIGQASPYQIAEVAALFKRDCIDVSMFSLSLVNPRKLKSYVRRSGTASKDDIIAWANDEGFHIPVKTRSQPGYKKQGREDLADAYGLARMARDLDALLAEGASPQTGHLMLDPETGLAFRRDLLFNRPVLEVHT